MGVTINDIARLAGVSKTTVSLTLNHRQAEKRVSPETVARINDLVKELGYRPSHAARALSNNKTHCLGFVSGEVDRELLTAIIQAAEAQGYRMMAMLTQWNREKELDCLNMLLDRMVDGIIMYGQALDSSPEMVEQLRAASAPLVMMENPNDLGFPMVLSDFVPALRQAFGLLCSTGHRRVMLILSSLCSGKRELLLERCEEFGCEPLEHLLHLTEMGLAACVGMIAHQRPDALLVEDAQDAMPLLAALRERDIDIPADISLIAFSGAEWLAYSNPPLTAINYDHNALAEAAVGALVKSLNGELAPRRQLVPTFLTVRGSVKTRSAIKGGLQ